MATREEKEKLVEALKFVPGTYNVRCWGYGGEIVLGTVERDVYNYFVEHEIDLTEYAIEWADEDCEIPDNFCPFGPGDWHECDDICHENGVEMSEYCRILVEDSEGNTVWEHTLEPFMLEDSEVEVECYDEYYAEFHSPGSIVFLGQSIEKGTFFNAEFELTAPFDPKKLKVVYSDVEGLLLMSQLFYNDEEIYNDGGDTRGKSMEFKFLNTD